MSQFYILLHAVAQPFHEHVVCLLSLSPTLHGTNLYTKPRPSTTILNYQLTMNPYQRNTEAAGSIDNFPPQGKGTPQSTDVRLSPRTIKMIEQYNTLNSGFHQHHTPLSGSKVILVGDPQVGKTSLFVRISKNLFEAVYRPTIGLDFQVKKYSVFGIPFNLTIWYLFLINIFLLID